MSKAKSDNGLVPSLRFQGFYGTWEVKAIGDLLTIGNGKDYKHLGKGNIPVYGTGGLMTHVNDYLHDGESVCIGRKGTIDKPTFLDGKFWTVDTLFYTHSFKKCLPKFIFSCFQNIEWQDYNAASGVPSLSKTTIENIEITITSLPEQTKIAAFLSSVDDLIALEGEKLLSLKTHKKGLMQQLFPANGATIPALRFPEFEGSGEWEVKSLEKVSLKITQGGTPDTSIDSFWNGDIEWLTPTEMGNSENPYIYTTARKITQSGLKNCSSELLPVNSIIISTRAPIGLLAINKNEMAFNQGCKGIIPNATINYLFLYYALNCHKQVLMDLGAGNTFKELSSNALKTFEILFPKFTEQQKIASLLSAFDDLIIAQGEKIDTLKLYKKGLMQQLFPQVEGSEQ